MNSGWSYSKLTLRLITTVWDQNACRSHHILPNLRVMDRIGRDTTVCIFVVLLHCFLLFSLTRHTSFISHISGENPNWQGRLLWSHVLGVWVGSWRFWFHSALGWKQILKPQNLSLNRICWVLASLSFLRHLLGKPSCLWDAVGRGLLWLV